MKKKWKIYKEKKNWWKNEYTGMFQTENSKICLLVAQKYSGYLSWWFPANSSAFYSSRGLGA